jgi:hypothetical protein
MAKSAKEDLLQIIASKRDELRLPGYWENLAENCHSWAGELSAGPFWRRAESDLSQWRTEYLNATGAILLGSSELPPFASKSRAGIQDKICRNWKRIPEFHDRLFSPSGPPIPNLSDLVRTRLTCPYIDGVQFLANKVESLAKECGVLISRIPQGNLQGYFAQHIGIRQSVFFRLAGHATAAEIECEIQIATTLATRMWDASHPVYETTREEEIDSHDWQWDPNNPRFISNQLGHMLHLADGLLVQLRASLRKQSKS